MGEHAVLPFSTMHFEFFADDRKHIDALMDALIEIEDLGLDSVAARRRINRTRGWKEANAAPRGNAKSTIKTRVEALRDICYQLEPFIVVYSNKGDQSEGRTWEILRELDTNQRIIEHFGELRGKIKWTRELFITCTGVRVQASSMMSESRGIADGPNRPTKVIFDDLENNEHVLSPVQRAKAMDWFTKVPLKLGGPNTPTNFSLAGTVLHEESILSLALKNPGWRGKKYKSMVKWPERMDLWDECKALFTDLENEDRYATAEAFYFENQEAMDEGAEVLWPEGEPLFTLMTMLWTDGPASFNSEKQNEPRDPSKQVFHVPDSSYFEMEQDEEACWVIVRSDGRRVLLSDCTTYAWLDPANPKPKSTDSDYAAICCVAQDDKGYVYVFDMFIEQCTANKFLRRLIEMHFKWQFDFVGIEDNGFQSLLKDLLARLILEYQAEDPDNAHLYEVPVRGVTQTKNKVERIAKMEGPIVNGWMLYRRALPAVFWDQMDTFPTGTHDDGPDANEGAYSLTRKGETRVRRL